MYGVPNGYYGPSYVIPILKPLPDAREECNMMREALENYGITDMGFENMYRIDDDPSIERCQDVMFSISKRLKDNRDKNFLIIYIFRGHGVQDMGS